MENFIITSALPPSLSRVLVIPSEGIKLYHLPRNYARILCLRNLGRAKFIFPLFAFGFGLLSQVWVLFIYPDRYFHRLKGICRKLHKPKFSLVWRQKNAKKDITLPQRGSIFYVKIYKFFYHNDKFILTNRKCITIISIK